MFGDHLRGTAHKWSSPGGLGKTLCAVPRRWSPHQTGNNDILHYLAQECQTAVFSRHIKEAAPACAFITSQKKFDRYRVAPGQDFFRLHNIIASRRDLERR